MITIALFLVAFFLMMAILIVKREHFLYKRYMKGDPKVVINAFGKLEEQCPETEKFYH